MTIAAVLAGLGAIKHERQAPLAKRTTFGIGGPADLLVTVVDEAELLTVLHDLGPHFSEELIRIHPQKIHSWGLD